MRSVGDVWDDGVVLIRGDARVVVFVRVSVVVERE